MPKRPAKKSARSDARPRKTVARVKAPPPHPKRAPSKAEAPKQLPANAGASGAVTDTGKAFPIEIDPKEIEATLKKVGDEISHWAKKGRYTKVRFKFRGKQLLPDLP